MIVKGGDIYIKNNIEYNDNSSDILWVIVLESENWDWWNIYIDPSVTHIAGTYYADKSMISYDGFEVDWNWSITLENQLYLYGALFSENTIWWSLLWECPYYVTENCDANESKKYDLNFMRRYFTYDWPDVDTLENNIYNWGDSNFSYPDERFENPMVIEYNPKIQSTPPPLFDND